MMEAYLIWFLPLSFVRFYYVCSYCSVIVLVLVLVLIYDATVTVSVTVVVVVVVV